MKNFFRYSVFQFNTDTQFKKVASFLKKQSAITYAKAQVSRCFVVVDRGKLGAPVIFVNF